MSGLVGVKDPTAFCYIGCRAPGLTLYESSMSVKKL